ncbi:MAG TPA: Hsp20/alpha crystallin family protein [Candidatus Paceibacterota bacterium]|nr:Hsp20/alpha crystallin family protein [Candidatus Paceibacterota bacterium]
MARDKKSLFEWLTGSNGAEQDYSFDDLESGPGFLPPQSQKPERRTRPAVQRESERERELDLPEEAMEGELSVDVYQTPGHIVIKAMIAGVRPEDLDVSITRDMVTIRGKREQHTEGSSGDFMFQELYWGSFSRTIVLPQEVEIEEAEATEKHGLLVIRLPKMDKGRQAKLKVRSN